jgi:hypothetical protein
MCGLETIWAGVVVVLLIALIGYAIGEWLFPEDDE